ncbi:methyltransferase domain-containing protein [Paenibacillus sp. p3-SID867]|uniref:class I SAM-dependent methyltransferase n=1 Tax=Paenibacillus sp. p3-SID867 TaxID=2916363 RepID=UPI0021A33580|nr:methyltransferase domain-containing protein [Paenibacillus sp. p3-SID867]MCT1403050.1 methyltransferase domain-containing protein [Paenibacillus sp. p3-SID867]
MKRRNDQTKSDYIPALRFHWLTSFYDSVLRWTMRESTFKNQLIKQVQSYSGQRILDLGCGTGTLTVQLKQSYPESKVTGLDIDPDVLRIAEAKAAQRHLDIKFVQGNSYELPYPDHSFDRVVTSLMFHHLTTTNKLQTLKEIFRVLKPEGELHIADWGKAKNGFMRVAYYSIQILDGFSTTTDNVKGLLPEFALKAGFHTIKETTQYATLYGSLSLYKAKKCS